MNKKGFTLVEMIVVIAIIGILSLIIVPRVDGYFGFSSEIECKSTTQAATAQFGIDALLEDKTIDTMDESFISNELANITEMGMTCPKGGNYSWDSFDKVVICSLHSQFHPDDPASQQYQSFTSFMNDFLSQNGGVISNTGDYTKGELFLQYYSDPNNKNAIAMSQEYRETLVAQGLNKTIKDPLYWWTYPVTDSKGNVLYTVTYANTQSNTGYWTDSNRGKMNAGYVVIVNGKTYIRSNSGITVEPANSTNPYQTPEALEATLIRCGYKVVE